MNTASPAAPDALLLAKPDAAKRLGIGKTSLQKLLVEGLIREVRIGKRVLIPDSELQRYVSSLLPPIPSPAAPTATTCKDTP